MKKWICVVLSLQLLFLTPVMGQADPSPEGGNFMENTQNDILIVAASGVGGGLLGLSTLSFYDTPSKHISNVWTGAALGIIVGVVFVAYNSAQKGSEELVSKKSTEEFSTTERLVWHDQNHQILSSPSVPFGTQIWQSSF